MRAPIQIVVIFRITQILCSLNFDNTGENFAIKDVDLWHLLETTYRIFFPLLASRGCDLSEHS